jgi:hypothetical protein
MRQVEIGPTSGLDGFLDSLRKHRRLRFIAKYCDDCRCYRESLWPSLLVVQ